MSIKHDHALSPITAVKWWERGRIILAAEGIHLNVFNVGSFKLIAQCRVFKEQSIHGIAISENEDGLGGLQVVVWGGASISTLYEDDLAAIVEGRLFDASSREFSAPDWILSVLISPSTEDFILLTAHNSLSRATFVPIRKEFSFEKLESPCRSILYSAHMIWESSSSIMVAAGTVFGEIIVWNCPLRKEGRADVLFTFTGHEGSIFGVHISLDKRLLASCSDDRTIRLWDISQRSIKEESNPDILSQKPDGDTSKSSKYPHSRCLAVAWGHASRIWRVHTHLFGEGDSDAERLGLLSFGEDATCQLWSIDFQALPNNRQSEKNTSEILKPSNFPDSGGVELKHQKTFAYHSGKHIWAADICSLRGSPCLITTGGADGKISCWEIPSKLLLSEPLPTSSDTDTQLGGWTLEKILGRLPPNRGEFSTEHSNELGLGTDTTGRKHEILPKQKKSKKPPKDGLNRYSFVTDKAVILTSTAGRVFLGASETQNELVWQELDLPTEGSLDLRGYSLIASVPELELAVFAGANGNIYKYRKGHRIKHLGSVEGKVVALFPTRNRNDGQFLHILVTVLGRSEASLFSWHEDGDLETVQNSSVFLPSNFMVTGAGKFESLIYLGSRSGAIGVIDTKEPRNMLVTYRPPVGEDSDAITSIIGVPTRGQDSSVPYILATSRNGTYKILSITTGNTSDGSATDISMVARHHSSPPLGSIENAWFEGSTLNFSGFRGKQFVVWNETQQSEVMAVECGGAHRSYAYSHLDNPGGGGIFVYTNASKLYFHSQKTGSHRTIKDGGHGREIKACAVSSGYKYFATGAEDTTIKIWKYHNETTSDGLINNKFECLSSVEKHSAGIQHLQWHGDNYLFSSGGVEEFYVWAIKEIPGFGVGILCEATLLDKSTEADLRIMSFDITEFPEDIEPISEPNTSLSEKIFLITLAYSDSTIKCYLYSKSKGFHRIAEGKYTSSCLTQIRYLPFPAPIPYGFETREGRNILCCDIFFLTTATDGHLTTWKFTLSDLTYPLNFSNLIPTSKRPIQMTRIDRHKVHQNAIKSLDLTSLSDSSYVVATGGDDDALALTYFGLYTDKRMTTIVKSAHGAAVTALTFVGKNLQEGDSARWARREIELRLVSSSNDQRVKAWDITVLDAGFDTLIDIKVTGDEFTSVADVGDMAVLRKGSDDGHGKIVVVGNGIDVWTI